MTDTDLVERLRGLIERLEKLKGPSRDLDWRIEKELVRAGSFPETALWPPFMVGSKFEKTIPAYTASLDAAVALVERVLPGWTGIVDFGGPTKCTATLVGPLREIGEDFDGAPVEIRDDAGGEGSTPAIALLIATLKALSQEPSK